jgi:hypothetical protein
MDPRFVQFFTAQMSFSGPALATMVTLGERIYYIAMSWPALALLFFNLWQIKHDRRINSKKVDVLLCPVIGLLLNYGENLFLLHLFHRVIVACFCVQVHVVKVKRLRPVISS